LFELVPGLHVYHQTLTVDCFQDGLYLCWFSVETVKTNSSDKAQVACIRKLTKYYVDAQLFTPAYIYDSTT